MLGSNLASAQSSPDAKTTLAVGAFQLSPTLEVRTLAEYRHAPVDLGGTTFLGAASPVVADAWTVLERSRVGLGAEHGSLRAQLTLQDARAWGELAAGPSSVGSLAAHEAFLQVHGKPATGNDAGCDGCAPEARRSFIRVGRQRVIWADGRLLGAADASPRGRSLDALRARLATDAVDFEVLAAALESSRPSGVSVDDTSGPYLAGSQLFGAGVAVAADPLLKLELYGLARLVGSAAASAGTSDFAAARVSGETYTGALRVSGASRAVDYAVAAFVQTGRATDLPKSRSLRLAYAFAGDVGRTFEGLLLSPSVHLGATLASGDDGDGNFAAFDPILPDVHTHQGVMNLFALSNVAIAHAALSVEAAPEVRFGAQYRYARLVRATGEWLDGYLVPVGRASRQSEAYELAHEADVTCAWRPLPQLELKTGYGAALLGDGARAILANQARGERQVDGTFKPAFVSHFAYLSATVRVP